MRKTAQCAVWMIALLVSVVAQAQDIGFGNATKYKIGGIEVTGTQSYNPSTVIAYTGLKKGDEVYLPGDKISGVIKKLWKLNLFSDINLYVSRLDGDTAYLELNIIELPNLKDATITGLKRKKALELKDELKLGSTVKVTENLVTTTKNFIENKYRKDGFLNAEARIALDEFKDSTGKPMVNMRIAVDRGEKVKIDQIEFTGNEALTDSKLASAMSNTKRKAVWRFWKRSKYIEEDFKEDLNKIAAKYRSRGYRDFAVRRDTIIQKDDGTVALQIDIEEGNKYYIGDIDFVGNTAYTDEQLKQIMALRKGDTYDGELLESLIDDQTDPNAVSLTNLYQNNGYLFSNIDLVERRVENDTIDFEVRVREGKLAYFDRITVTGNERTNDRVVYRLLASRPGEQYSKAKVLRSYRELAQSQLFDPEQINPQFLNPDPQAGTVDIEYGVVDQQSSQIELQGGYGGGGFVGTLGLRFNNFSLRNIFNGESYRPLPMGDGQNLALRAQFATYFSSFSLNFTEPWLGGKKPQQFNVSVSQTNQFFYDFRNREADRDRKFVITGISLGLARNLTWPDDYFTLSQAVSYQHFNLKNYNTQLFTFGDGFSNNLAYTIGLRRNNTATNPIFPTQGSEFNILAKLTPPYSAFNGVDYADLENQPEFQNADGTPNIGAIDQERFKFLEYYKVKFDGTWYTQLAPKTVLQTRGEFGFLGAYNNDRGVPPFERFFVGGDGLGQFSLDGREVVRLRGYPNQSLSNEDGGTIYNKFSLELRYAITLKQAASIYALAFTEGGASYDGFRNFNPFEINRSAGAGIRIFMPAFGLLGIDFGYGFDPIPGTLGGANGWETHFIIGQQF